MLSISAFILLSLPFPSIPQYSLQETTTCPADYSCVWQARPDKPLLGGFWGCALLKSYSDPNAICCGDGNPKDVCDNADVPRCSEIGMGPGCATRKWEDECGAGYTCVWQYDESDRGPSFYG